VLRPATFSASKAGTTAACPSRETTVDTTHILSVATLSSPSHPQQQPFELGLVHSPSEWQLFAPVELEVDRILHMPAELPVRSRRTTGYEGDNDGAGKDDRRGSHATAMQMEKWGQGLAQYPEE
jgi:hypothetical protein